jgi:hypothetical protein
VGWVTRALVCVPLLPGSVYHEVELIVNTLAENISEKHFANEKYVKYGFAVGVQVSFYEVFHTVYT